MYIMINRVINGDLELINLGKRIQKLEPKLIKTKVELTFGKFKNFSFSLV